MLRLIPRNRFGLLVVSNGLKRDEPQNKLFKRKKERKKE